MCDKKILKGFKDLLSGDVDPSEYGASMEHSGRCISLEAFGYPLGRNGTLGEALAMGRQGLDAIGLTRRGKYNRGA